ncbi:unnamed protein product [Cylindrotheca closterium]|uniref:Uncharacterized protein n=1 Tax=Cylindrotheca closterium TaxID=2856 RepID=A0AAD2CUS0_9STRA|nr:unnamed protein product [Cylindrotheca closterium]
MKDNIVNPPEKDPNLIMTVADQGQGGLEEKTRSNSTTQSSIALTKDNPAITTPKRSRKRNPSETAEDGAMKGRSLFPSGVPQGQDVTVNTRPNPTTPLSIELPTKFLCIPGKILASCLYFPTNSGSADLSPDMID